MLMGLYAVGSGWSLGERIGGIVTQP